MSKGNGVRKRRKMLSDEGIVDDQGGSTTGLSRIRKHGRIGVILAGVLVLVVVAVGTSVLVLNGHSRGSKDEVLGVVQPNLFKVLPHDSSCFTQGLFFHNGSLYESCGMYGASNIRQVDVETGTTILQTDLADNLFAEGIHNVDGEILALTWKSKQLLVYNLSTLEYKETYGFSTQTGEGWGISDNGDIIVVTDGSNLLHIWNRTTLEEIQRLPVVIPGSNQPVYRLNEIEFISKNELLANIWYNDKIARIDIRTGQVVGFLDFTGLLRKYGDPSGNPDVLNGIAYDEISKKLYVTGKYWKSLFVFNMEEL